MKRGKYLKKKTVFAALDEWNALPSPKPTAPEYLNTVFGGFKDQKRFESRMRRLVVEWLDKVLAEPLLPDHPPDPPAPVSTGTMEDPPARRAVALHGARTYVFTCAQNNTDLIPRTWWENLLTLVDHKDAELHVSQFTYNKSQFGKNSVKPDTTKASDSDELWYANEIAPYISNDDLQITPDLVWLGSLCISPTAVNPITGFQNHTREASCIIPHTKIAMESVATMKQDPAKFCFTTGAVTQRNYIQKAAGQKADFHHVFGALLVEVDEQGNWWARQLNFDKDGVLYDLDEEFHPVNGITPSVRAAAITHGDIHGYKVDEGVIDSVFTRGGLMDKVRPREQFFHDIIDFMPRNHHNRKDFMFLSDMHKIGKAEVSGEFEFVGRLLSERMFRHWCKTFIVVSNHDQAVNSWLADRTQLDDPVNLEEWLKQNLRRVRDPNYHPFREMIKEAAGPMPVTVILEDMSYKILGQIEAGLHGHLGPNGARGAPRNLRTAGKANTAHTHSAGIVEGVYTCGVLGKLDMGYNKGLSSWSHSSTLTYPNAKRTILTMRAGKWHR